jgi:N-acetylglutamate synthase-like GNAT family acetyltransferase
MAGFVRDATLADSSAIFRIDRDVVGSDERFRFLEESIRAGECMVYEHHGDVLGYALMRRRHFYARDFVELVVVAVETRRQGIGRSLLRAAVHAASTPQVFTSTNASNAAMQALLASDAWAVSGRLTGLDPDDPEVVYYYRRA